MVAVRFSWSRPGERDHNGKKKRAPSSFVFPRQSHPGIVSTKITPTPLGSTEPTRRALTSQAPILPMNVKFRYVPQYFAQSVHNLHSVSENAAVSGATAPKPPTIICALARDSSEHRHVRDAKLHSGQNPTARASRFVIGFQHNPQSSSLDSAEWLRPPIIRVEPQTGSGTSML